MQKTFCDVCTRVLTRNVVTDRLTLVMIKSGFEIEVLVSKNGISNAGDLCLNCLLEMINQQPKRKYERKKKMETVITENTTATGE